VADNFVGSPAIVYQQTWGKVLTLKKALSMLPRALSEKLLAAKTRHTCSEMKEWRSRVELRQSLRCCIRRHI